MPVAGIGFRAACPAADIVAAVRLAEARAGLAATAVAAPWFKDGAAPLREALAALGLPLHLVDAAGLAAAQPACRTRSAAVAAATGHASIAEAAALAASGGVLLLPRIVHGQATCALAGSGAEAGA